MKKIALITGITGQDGSYLTDFLLKKNYLVHGLVRRSSSINRERLNHYFDINQLNKNMTKLKLHYGDLTDTASIYNIIKKIKPSEIYNLAAQSHVGTSFDIPNYTLQVISSGTLNILEAVKNLNLSSKIYQAGSSEMFGNSSVKSINENTKFYPRSPYGAAKVYAHNISINYREAYNLFVSNGILFNHESPRRGENFVTRKITLAAANIKLGYQKKLVLGNLKAKRDWGYAKDYVEAMWKMLQLKKSDDFIIATNRIFSVEYFCKIVFDMVDLDYKKFITTDKKYLRPTEIDELRGDYSKAKKI